MKRLALAALVLSFAACSTADDTTVDTAAVPAAAPAPTMDSMPVMMDSTMMMDSTTITDTTAAAAPAGH